MLLSVLPLRSWPSPPFKHSPTLSIPTSTTCSTPISSGVSSPSPDGSRSQFQRRSSSSATCTAPSLCSLAISRNLCRLPKYAQIWSHPTQRDWASSDSFRLLSTALRKVAADKLRLSRLNLPTVLDPSNLQSQHLLPGLTHFLSVCEARQVVVVFEDVDGFPGGQRISQDFLDFAKGEKTEQKQKEQEQAEGQEVTMGAA